MRRFTRFLRVILFPVAVLAVVAGSSASASASTLPGTDSGTQVVQNTYGPGPIPTSSHW